MLPLFVLLDTFKPIKALIQSLITIEELEYDYDNFLGQLVWVIEWDGSVAERREQLCHSLEREFGQGFTASHRQHVETLIHLIHHQCRYHDLYDAEGQLRYRYDRVINENIQLISTDAQARL